MRDGTNRCKLGELISIKHGFAFASEHFSSEGPYVLLTPGNFLEGGGFRWLGEKQKFYGGVVPEDFILRPGDMLVAMTEQAPGLLGSTFFVPDGQQFLHNQRLGLIQLKAQERLHDRYLHYYLSLPEVRRIISAESAGTKVKHTSPERLHGIEVPLPPLLEQRKIAAILQTWDEAIEKLSALRAAKAKRHLGLTNSLVFGGMQLDEYHRSDEFASHRWFTLPSSWGCHPIGELAMEVSERNIGGDAFEVLSCSKYDGFVRSLEYFKKQVFSADLTSYKKIWRGDFGFPSNHVEEGSIGLQNLTETGVVSPIYTVFRFNPALVLGEYAFSVLKTEVYRHIFAVSTSASVDRRGSLRWKEFARLPFPLPPLAEQVSIAEVLNTSRSEIDALDTEIEAVSRQKRGLMQKLLTGEWRVKLSDEEEAAA